jgi:SAM-dependent methyltransferase
LTKHHYQEDLAYIHHVGFGTLARDAAPWVLKTLRTHGIRDGVVVELGCGTGLLLSTLSAAGYQTIGIDASNSMLAIAASTAPSAHLIQASLYRAELPRCHALIAMGEPLNYVSSPEVEPPTLEFFSGAAAALSPGGLLLFDVMTRLPNAVTPYRSWSAGPDWACLVELSPHPDGHALRRAITTFRLHCSGYRRSAEEHWVHLFPVARLRRQLERSGFTVRTASSYGHARLAPGRRLFHCMRRCA